MQPITRALQAPEDYSSSSWSRHRMQTITRELQAVSFLVACNIFNVQPRNFNDGNTLTPTVGLQPFATGRELLRKFDLLLAP